MGGKVLVLPLGSIEFVMGEKGGHDRRDFTGELVTGGVDSWGEREGTVGQHELGKVLCVGSRLDAQVSEHSVGFPTPQTLYSIRVNGGTQ